MIEVFVSWPAKAISLRRGLSSSFVFGGALFCVSIPAVAQTDPLSACMIVYDDNVRSNYASNSAELNYISIYDQYCDRTTGSLRNSSDASLNVVVEDIPVGFQNSSETVVQQFQNFCKAYQSVRNNSSNNSVVASAPVTDGLTDFNKCIAIANAGIQVIPRISHNFVSLSVKFSGLGVKVQAVEPSASLKCTSTSIGGGRTLTPTSSGTLSSNFTINCNRTTSTRTISAADGTFTDVAPSADIILGLSSGAFRLQIPEDDLDNYIEGRANSQALATLDASILAANETLSNVTNQLNAARSAVADEKGRIAKITVSTTGVYYGGDNNIYPTVPHVDVSTGNIGSVNTLMTQLATNVCNSSLSIRGSLTRYSPYLYSISQHPYGCCGTGVRSFACASLPDEQPSSKSFASAKVTPLAIDNRRVVAIKSNLTRAK